jgi:hypothetical protein
MQTGKFLARRHARSDDGAAMRRGDGAADIVAAIARAQ